MKHTDTHTHTTEESHLGNLAPPHRSPCIPPVIVAAGRSRPPAAL